MADLNSTQGPTDRKIRLKNLLDKGSAIGGNVESEGTVDTISAIKNIIVESDEIIDEGNVGDRAEHTTEVVMDAQLLKISHQTVDKVLEASTDFNDGIYQNAIANLVFRDDNDNWNALAEIAIGICRASKFSTSMLGSFDLTVTATQKPNKEKQQKRRTKNNAEELEPEEMAQLEKQDKGAKKVKIILKQIVRAFEENNRFPLPFYQLVIDPDNFMNTVENVFQVAFLARDGAVAIETGDGNMPHVRVTNPKEKDLVKHTNQSVCSINMDVCKEMIAFYDIKEAMLKIERST
ncbi:EP300-interacting inhibitor of differentiation 3 [Episyrphus balteatus]|uniref:EP300-interacting inhibitor of differentiation 3 n=1 Tax=Episyrphus balteatus TaxID=286459 RepID=UPI0024853B11|nr:EP300-interacting inhibitor of differentiation 3 [Episyrphus balteatus]